MYKEIAKPPEKLNKTRGIGVITAPPELVATVVADEYEAWDDSIKDLKTLTSQHDPVSGALVEICWTRYCLRESNCSTLTLIDDPPNSIGWDDHSTADMPHSSRPSSTNAPCMRPELTYADMAADPAQNPA